jgi:hypothetical protein
MNESPGIIGTVVTPAFVITDLHMAGDAILTESRVVNRHYLIQTLHKGLNFGQRLPIDLKGFAFFLNIFLLTELLHGDIFCRLWLFYHRNIRVK